MVSLVRKCALFITVAIAAFAQRYHVYIGNVGPESVLIAWGTTDGDNTIGRSSPSLGNGVVKIKDQSLNSRQNWLVVGGLQPDTVYPYQVLLNDKPIGQGTVRTLPAAATKLCFFVIGDYGNGTRIESAIAQAMIAEYEKRANGDNPPRFVLTLGDNIYGDVTNMFLGVKHTGDHDSDWENKFFGPYQQLIAHIPFYPTLGNHDGNETENRGDLTTYLDNFFFPYDKPARWYTFDVGGLADFFALDTTLNTESGSPTPAYFESGLQSQWLKQQLARSRAPWKIPYFHHPLFSAGPSHVPNYRELAHWAAWFQQAGVKVVFTGHEHNLQISEANALSGGIRYFVAGAGGQLRPGNVLSKMRKANIEGWAPQNHFLVVEIDGKTMRVMPVSFQPVVVRTADGGTMPMPLTITLP